MKTRPPPVTGPERFQGERNDRWPETGRNSRCMVPELRPSIKYLQSNGHFSARYTVFPVGSLVKVRPALDIPLGSAPSVNHRPRF